MWATPAVSCTPKESTAFTRRLAASPAVGKVCEVRIGTGPPRARTEVIHADLGHWAVSGSIHPRPISVQKLEFRVSGLGLSVSGVRYRVWGVACGVQGAGCRV